MHALKLLGCSCLLLVTTQGCKRQPPMKLKETKTVDATNIVTQITSTFYIQHEAQVGQTLEWRIEGSGKTDFWIFFGPATPCGNGDATLHGSAGHPASCVVGRSDGSSGTVQYSYELHQNAPPPGGYPDRVGRCVGCTD